MRLISIEDSASMRPRHYTAENGRCRGPDSCRQASFNEAAALHRGKRRRPIPPIRPAVGASMRPRHYTAENPSTLLSTAPCQSLASMRPRHYTAENATRPPTRSTRCTCFNEAAALHRGKPSARHGALGRRPLASMRPRHYTAENERSASARCEPPARFNEAAALHRGKLRNVATDMVALAALQ